LDRQDRDTHENGPKVDPALTALADRLHSTAIRVLREVRSVDKETGLSAARLSVLSVLVFRGPATITELAEAEQVRPPTISRMVKDMQFEGLVSRSPDAADGRIQRIEATARGQQILTRGRQRRVEALAARVAPLSAADRRVVQRALDILDG
jgi:DNA-binding MarR family transcriptional regulator